MVKNFPYQPSFQVCNNNNTPVGLVCKANTWVINGCVPTHLVSLITLVLKMASVLCGSDSVSSKEMYEQMSKNKHCLGRKYILQDFIWIKMKTLEYWKHLCIES